MKQKAARSPNRDVGFGAQRPTVGDCVSHPHPDAARMWRQPREERYGTPGGMYLGVTVFVARSRLHGPRSRVWAELDGAWDDLLICTSRIGGTSWRSSRDDLL